MRRQSVVAVSITLGSTGALAGGKGAMILSVARLRLVRITPGDRVATGKKVRDGLLGVPFSSRGIT